MKSESNPPPKDGSEFWVREKNLDGICFYESARFVSGAWHISGLQTEIDNLEWHPIPGDDL
jgi:hypothetical protein